MEQKFVSFSLDEIKNGNHDSKIRNHKLSVNQITPRMAKSSPWCNHHSVCKRLKFSSFLLEQAVFSSIERTDCIAFSSPNPIVHRMTKTQMSFGHSVGNRFSFGHSVGNRTLLSFGHSVVNGVKEIHSCACPLCCNKLAIMTCGCDYNLKVFHGRWFCYSLGMTIELYLFLVSKLWL